MKACFLCVLNLEGIYDSRRQIFRNKYFGVSSMILSVMNDLYCQCG
jgi:hypothetical protein